ncbi:hypothetical protein NL676_004567 [Syzygium grande]|nr:hypothetical protein NL676_004567 [Syzygium grande]
MPAKLTNNSEDKAVRRISEDSNSATPQLRLWKRQAARDSSGNFTYELTISVSEDGISKRRAPKSTACETRLKSHQTRRRERQRSRERNDRGFDRRESYRDDPRGGGGGGGAMETRGKRSGFKSPTSPPPCPRRSESRAEQANDETTIPRTEEPLIT